MKVVALVVCIADTQSLLVLDKEASLCLKFRLWFRKQEETSRDRWLDLSKIFFFFYSLLSSPPLNQFQNGDCEYIFFKCWIHLEGEGHKTESYQECCDDMVDTLSSFFLVLSLCLHPASPHDNTKDHIGNN